MRDDLMLNTSKLRRPAVPADMVVWAAAAVAATAVVPEKQQLVAGVFPSKAAYDAIAGKLKTMGTQLQMVNASNLLVIAKDDAGKVDVDVLDVGSSAGVDLMTMAQRVAAGVEALSGNAPSSATDLAAHASHLGLALNPGAVALGVFVNKQYAAKIEDALRKMGAQVLTADDLKRIGAGLGAAAGMNDLAAKSAMAAQAPAPPPPAVFDWHAEHAYSLAIQAFVWGFLMSTTPSRATSGQMSLRTPSTCPTRPSTSSGTHKKSSTPPTATVAAPTTTPPTPSRESMRAASRSF